MKKLLFTLLLVLLAVTAQAKTATVTYTFTDWPTYTVCIFVSESPDLAAQSTMIGQCDIEDDGVVEIGNINTGKTYYFGARGYNKITGQMTNWSNEIAEAVPAETLPILGTLPEITVPNFPGWTIQSINIAPVQ